MKFMRAIIFLGLLPIYAFSDLSYKVEYMGIEDSASLKTIKSTIQLNTLKKKKPDSIQALKYRAEADIPTILKILHAHGYYEATVEIQVQENPSEAIVLIKVHLGPAYILESFTISLFQGSKDQCISCSALTLANLNIHLNKPILAENIINAELKALYRLSLCGYPLAFIKDRSIVADGDTRTVKVHLDIDAGPLSYFGPLTVDGQKSVKPLFFEQKLEWKEGAVYSGEKVEEMQKSLMDTGLFSSILITHAETPLPDGTLPMHIEVAESKHKSLFGGVSYQTYYGPGLTFGWEHRNIAGLGRKLSLQGDITKRSHSGIATYIIPNFLKINQDLVWQAQAVHLSIMPYTERSYHLTNRWERKLSKKMRFSVGVEGERLFVNSSVLDGDYWLAQIPLFLAINQANSLLNPTKGINFEYKMTPSFTISPDRHAFLVQEFAFSTYLPTTPTHVLTFAQKLSGGCIISEKASSVPITKRFFGGSEDELRGYAYYSVSPFDAEGKPIGGMSAIYYTFETRIRCTKTLGLVPFFDMGTVSSRQFFGLTQTWLKSVGIGARYFSFVGPFRFDIGFPLNPRKHIDKKYRILISVGQAF
jgi:translocation and assembly module TamA